VGFNHNKMSLQLDTRIYLPEIWRRKGLLFKKLELLGEFDNYPGRIIGGIRYLIEGERIIKYESEIEKPCFYCGGKSQDYLKKYKAGVYSLKRIPPPQAHDLDIRDEFLFIIFNFYTRCLKCGGVTGEDERINLLKLFEGLLSNYRGYKENFYGFYDNKELSEIKKQLTNLKNWSSEEIVIYSMDWITPD
jgi:hypothetical protein